MEISNTSNGTLISGSADNDSIINAGENVTIDSGAGSDSITLSSDGREYVALSSVTSAEIIGFENGTLDSSDAIYLVDGNIYNSTFEFKTGTRIINNLGGSVSISSSNFRNTFEVMIGNQRTRAINDSISAAFDSNIDYYALGNDSTLTAVTGTTKINDIELITNGHLTVTGKHYELDDGSSYNLAQTITGLSGGDSLTVNDLWSDATFAYYVSDDGTTISRISDNSIVYTGSADTLSSLNFGTISFMDYFTQTVGEVVDAFNSRYATFNNSNLTIDAKTLRNNLNTQITSAKSELSTVTTLTSALVIDKMDDIIKNVISSDVSIKNLLNEDMYNELSNQIDTKLKSGDDPLDIFSNFDNYNGDIFDWICDSLIVPVAQILGDTTLDRIAANLANRLSSHNTNTIILNGSEDTVSIGAYYGDSIDASQSTTHNLIIAEGAVTDSPQRDLIILVGSNSHTGSIQNALLLGNDTISSGSSTMDLNLILVEGTNTLESTGTYTLNDITITTTKDNTLVELNNDGTISFAADTEIAINGYPIDGTGIISIADGEIYYVMTETSDSFNIDSRTFNMIADAEEGVTVTTGENTFEVAHVITEPEVEAYDDTTDDDLGKVFSENITIAGDDSYTVSNRNFGVSIVSGLSGDATVDAEVVFGGVENEYGTGFKFVTDEEGTFTFGGKNITIVGDNSVTLDIGFNADGTAFVENYDGLDGDASIMGANTTIENSESGVIISGTALNDNISNEGSNVTINALGGDDEIINIDSGGVLINAGEGNNAVSNLLNYSTVTGASDFSGVSIVGGSGNDSIYNIGGNYASIVSGSGDDYISNRHGYYPTISAGDGNDFIRISNGHYQNIDAGAGDDTITAVAEVFNSGDWAMGGYATMLGGDGNDLITPIYSNNAYIDGGSGDDTIITNGIQSTITGGSGNNFISLTSAETDTSEGVVVALVEGENSTVEGFKSVSNSEVDTLYFVDGIENKAVGFTDEGLSFWTDTVMGGSDYLEVTFTNINDTTLLNLKYGTEPSIVEAFVNDGDIYQVSTGAADIFVGAVATHNQGLNFEGVSNATITVDGLFGDGKIGDTDVTFANFESLIGDSNTTFILGEDTLKTMDSVGAVTIKSSEDGTATVIGVGDWTLNDSTVTLSRLSSLVSGENGLEVYDEGMRAAESSKNALLAYNPDANIYNASQTESIMALEDPELWQNDMYIEAPTLPAGQTLEGDFSTDTGRKITFINNDTPNIIYFNDEGGNAAIIGNNASNQQILTAGIGGDTLENYSSKAEVSMIGGAGDDAILATSGTNEYIDVSTGGKDTIAALNSDTLTVYGYEAKNGATFLMNTHENLTNLIMYGDPYLLVVGDGYFKADNLGRVVLDGTDTLNGTFVNFTTYDDGSTQLYGWSGQAGGNVDGSDYENAILIGVAPSGYSTLKGGNGNDTIYAAADDVVSLSGGSDLIDIDHLEREWRINGNIGGLTINFGDGNLSAKTTVKGFDSSQDKIALNNIDELSFDFSNDNLQLVVNSSSLTFKDITESTNMFIGDELTAFIADNSTISVTNDSFPTKFYGNVDAVVDYSNYNDTLNINLNNNFNNINIVKGGAGTTSLWGSDSDNSSLYAGTGETSIFGGFGGANDNLFGYEGDNKSGSTTFFVFADSGSDTIEGFEFGTGETADKLNTFGQDVTATWFDSQNAFHVQIGDNVNDQAIINNAKNQIIKVNASSQDWIVEFGDDLTYNDSVNCYSYNFDTKLKIDDNYIGENVAIWSNGWDGKIYNNVKEINASAYNGEATLVGNALDNIVTASNGNSSLWGGEGNNNDTLIGSSGYNEFFYLKGNGNDVITNVEETDLINLLDINLDDISEISLSDSAIEATFKEGGQISINTTDEVTVQLVDGSKWQSDKINKGWKLKE